MPAAMNLVCSSLIMSLVPAMTRVFDLIFASSSGATLGSLTISPSISAFRLADSLFSENLSAMLYPISMGTWVVRFTPSAFRFAPFRIRRPTRSGCRIAKTMAIFPPSEKPSR